jgi:hypothetical protein
MARDTSLQTATLWARISRVEFTSKEGYEGLFIIFNEPDEVALIPFARLRACANGSCRRR